MEDILDNYFDGNGGLADFLKQLGDNLKGVGYSTMCSFQQLLDLAAEAKNRNEPVFQDTTLNGLEQNAVDFRNLCRTSASYSGATCQSWLNVIIVFYDQYTSMETHERSAVLEVIIQCSKEMSASFHGLQNYADTLNGRINEISVNANSEISPYKIHFDQMVEKAIKEKKSYQEQVTNLSNKLEKKYTNAIIFTAISWIGVITAVFDIVVWTKVKNVEKQLEKAEQQLNEALVSYRKSQSAEERAKQLCDTLATLLQGVNTMLAISKLMNAIFGQFETYFRKMQTDTDPIKKLPNGVINAYISTFLPEYKIGKENLNDFSSQMQKITTHFVLNTKKTSTPLPPLIILNEQLPPRHIMRSAPRTGALRISTSFTASSNEEKEFERSQKPLNLHTQKLELGNKIINKYSNLPSRFKSDNEENEKKQNDIDDTISTTAFTAYLVAFPPIVISALQMFQRLHAVISTNDNIVPLATRNVFDYIGKDIRDLAENMRVWTVSADPYNISRLTKVLFQSISDRNIKNDDLNSIIFIITEKCSNAVNEFQKFSNQWGKILKKLKKAGKKFTLLQADFIKAIEEKQNSLIQRQEKAQKAQDDVDKIIKKIKEQKTFTLDDAKKATETVVDISKLAIDAACANPNIGDIINVGNDLTKKLFDWGQSIYDRQKDYLDIVTTFPKNVKKASDAQIDFSIAKQQLNDANTLELQAKIVLDAYKHVLDTLINTQPVYSSLSSWFNFIKNLFALIDLNCVHKNSIPYQYLFDNVVTISNNLQVFSFTMSQVNSSYPYEINPIH